MVGTQLSDMTEMYNDAAKSISGIELIVKRMEEGLPEKKARLKELVKKVEATKKIADQRKKLKALQGEQGWALVIEKEKVCWK